MMERGIWGGLVVAGVVVVMAGCGGAATGDGDGGFDGEATACGGSCDDGVYCNGAERCMPGGTGADARGCVVGSAPCPSACSETTRTCTEACFDHDGDGVQAPPCGGDCDDEDPARHPGAPETCDVANVDEDCDPSTFGVRDADSDTYPDARCCNGTSCGSDCDDTSSGVHPGLPDSCDGRDNDCDGAIDEGVVPTFYPDDDHDGYGAVSSTTAPRMQCLTPGLGWSSTQDDCDDTRDDIHPGATEQCNGLDDNCRDGTSDEVGCACSITAPPEDCGTDEGVCMHGSRTCVGGAWGPCNGQIMAGTETCSDPTVGTTSATDEDCDTHVDEGLTASCWVDADNDTYGEGSARMVCSGAAGGCPSGTATRGGDCALGLTIHPGAPEICNSGDDDCDTRIDEGTHARRVDVSPSVTNCAVYEYGRDMQCEQRSDTACQTPPTAEACSTSGFFVAAGGVTTIGCLTPAVRRTDIHLWELTARHSGCNGTSGEYNACQAAAYRTCREYYGASMTVVSGYTFLVGTVPERTYALICVDSTQAEVRSVSWSELNARTGGGGSTTYCNGPDRDGYWCARAVDQWCREQTDAGGAHFVTGFGPSEYSGGGTTVTCLRSY